MKWRMICICFLLLGVVKGVGQCGLQSGPMPGHRDMLEVTIWAQTKCAQKIQMRYWIQTQPATTWLSRPVMTTHEHGYCAHLIADQVQPGYMYQYTLSIDDIEIQLPYPTLFTTQSLWQWRTDPKDFSFVAGSCTYINEPEYDRPGKPYGGGYEIFLAIRDEQPDFMIWLGDNIYLREVDWNTHTGIYHRYTHMRSVPELQPLLAATHHYAIWDDHDYGPNDSDRSYWGKHMTLQAFKDFWANPNYGVGGTEGITGTFFWEDCQFFVMDDRWYRSDPKDGVYYGSAQFAWLLDALRYSDATYKFICTGGQVLSNAKVFENYAQYPRERKALLDSLDKYNISGVVFLSGDRHHSEVSKVTTPDGYSFYDITSSPLTSGATGHPDEPNTNRISGSMIGERNYAVISIAGPRKARQCKLTFKNSLGESLYELILDPIRK